MTRISMTMAAAITSCCMVVASPAAAQQIDAPTTASAPEDVSIDLDSWRSLQCMAIFFLALGDESEGLSASASDGIMLNIGYHLGRFDARSPDTTPSALIGPAIAETFAEDGIPAEVNDYCQAASQELSEQVGGIETFLDQVEADAKARATPAAPPPASSR